MLMWCSPVCFLVQLDGFVLKGCQLEEVVVQGIHSQASCLCFVAQEVCGCQAVP